MRRVVVPMFQKTPFSNCLQPERRWMTLAIICWAVVFVVLAGMFVISPHKTTGFSQYVKGAEHWLEGLPVYDYRQNKGFTYSPIVAVCITPLTMLPSGVANILWRFLNAGCLLAGVSAVLNRGPFANIPRRLHGVVYVLLLPLSVGNLDSGQANPLVIGLIMLSVSATGVSRYILAAGVMALAVYLKIYPLAAGLLLVLVTPTRFTVALIGFLVVLGFLPFLFQNAAYVTEQYRLWAATRLSDNRLQYPMNIAPLDLWYVLVRVGGVPLSELMYHALRVAGGGAIALFCVYGRLKHWASARVLGGLFVFVSLWMVLLGPATEALTYALLAPAAVVCLVETVCGRGKISLRVPVVLAFALLLFAVLRVGFFHRWQAPWVLAVQPIGAICLLAYALQRYLDSSQWRDREPDRAAPVTSDC